MAERNKRRKRVDPKIFVYASGTKRIDIPKKDHDSPASRLFCERDSYKSLNALQVIGARTTYNSRRHLQEFNPVLLKFVSDASLENPSISDNGEDALVVFPEMAMLKIHQWAFRSCKSLRKIVICSVSTKLGKGAFRGCSGLVSVELPDGLQAIETLPSGYLPVGLLEIGAGSFQNCDSIETLPIPSTVFSIGSRAFRNCSRLKYLKMPPILERIERELCYGCERLEFIEIPATVKEIHELAFCSCPSMLHIRIPPSVNSIHHDAFLHCSELISFEIRDDVSFDINLSKSLSLVDVAGPILNGRMYSNEDFLHNSKLSRVFDNEADLLHKLKHRFDNCPLNKLWDSFGSTPLDYLCLNRTPTSIEVIRRVLQTRFDYLLGLARPWKPDMLQAVEEALEVDWSSRRRKIGIVYFNLANYERKEIISIVELYLWKAKIADVSGKEQTVNREFCRVNCGASIVIPHVLSFLDKPVVEDYFVSSP
eukprot:scaffold19863_cov136-Cylindrotheca_fusiformis.AAC.1